MDSNIFNLNNQIYSNNNDILLEIINELNQIKNNSNDNLIIKNLAAVINKLNLIINENKKNLESIRNEISSLYTRLNQKFENNFNNNSNTKELQFNTGKYVGQVANGIAEGKGTFYFIDGDRYEGDYKCGKREGKGNLLL